MSDPTGASGYRDTKWGRCCVIIYDEMMHPSTETEASPVGLSLNVGPDDAAKIGAAPLITFSHAGEQPRAPFRGGRRSGGHAWDRDVLLDVELWGRTPAEAEALEEQLLIALDTVAHGRAGKPGKFKPMIGSLTAGNLGAKIEGTITIIPSYVARRESDAPLGVMRTIPRSAVATSHEVTVSPSAQDGNGEEVTLD